jgi:hypothetical protein
VNAIAYSIGTLVTNWDQHRSMRASFEAKGFTVADCEYLTIDNTGPDYTDAFGGLNAMLNDARGVYAVLCHQDVRLVDDGREVLDRRLAELSALDPRWAVTGNAGATASGDLVIRISDKVGKGQRLGTFPSRVVSLDENFIVVKRDTRVGFSRDLLGFHFYGADVCLVADIVGYSSYVIDFHLLHLGRGAKGEAFDKMKAAFTAKWRHALRDRNVQTTSDHVVLGAPRGTLALSEAAYRWKRVVRRLRRSINKRLPSKPGAVFRPDM